MPLERLKRYLSMTKESISFEVKPIVVIFAEAYTVLQSVFFLADRETVGDVYW